MGKLRTDNGWKHVVCLVCFPSRALCVEYPITTILLKEALQVCRGTCKNAP